MDATYASYQARLATFAAAATTKTRRTSNRSKKAAPKAKPAWPLSSPAPEDLAFAGFVWKPTTASLDNVQCFNCNCQLDGWEESDVPVYEHLTHSPNCGFAIVTCIRLRNGDPGRTEDDPTSDRMVLARQETFGDLWPLDPATGFPSVDQMVAAGWIYDPTEGNPDGVTCPYCALSLDAWDEGDDPLQEHSRRSSDCLFFALKDLYHPAPPAKKGKRASTKAKRTSSRSSTASTTAKKPRTSTASTTAKKSRSSTASTTTKKATRGKKRTSEAMDEPELSDALEPSSKRIRSSSISSFPEGLPAGTPKKMPTEFSDMKMSSLEMSSFSPVMLDGTPKKTSSRLKEISSIEMSSFSAVQLGGMPKKTSSRTKETSTFEMSSLPPDLLVGTPKKTPSGLREATTFEMSSLPSDLLVGTPKKTPSGLREATAFEMSSLPLDLLVGTPKKTPSRMRELSDNENWQPTDIESFFNSQECNGLINDVLVDAGLDDITASGVTAANLLKAVMSGLTDQEKEMTIEQWVIYNAQRGAEKLRMLCEQQILAFEAEGRRAMAMLEGISTY